MMKKIHDFDGVVISENVFNNIKKSNVIMESNFLLGISLSISKYLPDSIMVLTKNGEMVTIVKLTSEGSK